jgi:uncharacterized lipoprotein YddW (UPF0748 family)
VGLKGVGIVMKLPSKLFIALLILLLATLSTASSFWQNRISSLEHDIAELRTTLETSRLQMRRLDYPKLEEIINDCEVNLKEAQRLLTEKDDSEEAQTLIVNVVNMLNDIKPFLCESLSVETRGMWVDNFTIDTFYTQEDVAKHLDELKAINVNVIFPDVYGNGSSIYPSKVVPQKQKFQVMFEEKDVLEMIIEEAHKRDIEVHPLVRVFGLHNGAEHFIDSRSDWLDKTSEGLYTLSNGYFWLCPAHPEVREYNIAMLKELTTNYDIDGIHLDYIRYDADFGYNDFMRSLFQQLYGIDPFDIDSPRMESIFTVFKQQFVNKFIERTYYELKAIKPELLISAAVASPYSWGKNDLGQDWLNWIENRQINFLTPMSYRTTVDQYTSTVRSEINTVSSRSYIYTGLGIYLYDGSVLLGQIQGGRDSQITGQAVFSTANMKSYHYKALKDGPWRSPAIPTFRDPLNAAQILIDDSIARLQEFEPVINAEPELITEYVSIMKDISADIKSLDIRPWDTRDLRQENLDEVTQLEPIIEKLKDFRLKINRDSKREQLIPDPTAERLINDIECVRTLLQPLLYTSLPFEYVPTR